ncbi:hypothetical protein ABT024_35025 [Streptomyces sp. NPDC002812]|uniref:hypothetical protein n=1 Tax=Streptomyces sp. NPDC002812 TaxID=3154434 RepID=UPI00332D1A8C
MRPVLEMCTPDGFDLWPVADVERFGFLPLGGELSPAEVGAAIASIASCNGSDNDEDGPTRPVDPLASFLHGLLTFEDVFAAGGLQVKDTSADVTFQPGCCDGLEDWRDWHQFADGGSLLGFGHTPVSPMAERFGDTVRLTVDGEQSDSPVIELSVTELRTLLEAVERDLAEFFALATDWILQHLPGHGAPVTAAVARALDLAAPAVTPTPHPDVIITVTDPAPDTRPARPAGVVRDLRA